MKWNIQDNFKFKLMQHHHLYPLSFCCNIFAFFFQVILWITSASMKRNGLKRTWCYKKRFAVPLNIFSKLKRTFGFWPKSDSSSKTQSKVLHECSVPLSNSSIALPCLLFNSRMLHLSPNWINLMLSDLHFGLNKEKIRETNCQTFSNSYICNLAYFI